MKTLLQRPYDFSLNQELQQETMALMSIMKRLHTDDEILNKKLQNQLDIYTHHKARKLELLEDEAELILEGLRLEEEQEEEEEEQEEAQAVITSRSLDLTGIRFTDVPAKLDLSPTSSEESISNLILPVTEDTTLRQEEAKAVITSRSLDLTGIRFTDAPAKLDLSPTSSEESISNLILPVTEDATLSQEPVEVTGHARDCCAFDSSTMCTLL